MLILLCFLLFLQNSMGLEAQIWNGANYSYIIHSLNGTKIFEGRFDFKVDTNIGNITFPNIVTISNYTYWSYDNSVPYLQFFNDFVYDSFMVECDNVSSGCTVDFPNTAMEITIWFRSWHDAYYNSDFTYFNDGVIFNYNGSIPNFNQQCWAETDISHVHDMNVTTHFCYKDFAYVNIPDNNQDVCKEFETTAFVTDLLQNRSISFDVQYILLVDRINVTFRVFQSIDMVIDQIQLIHTGYILENYCTTSGTILTCNYVWEIPTYDDFQNEFIFFYSDPDDWFVTVGELIRRNGIFVRDINVPFTRQNPCWEKSGEVILSLRSVKLSYNATFCCKKFENTISTAIFESTSTTLKMYTTSSPSPLTIDSSSPQPTDKPLLNSAGTLCSVETSQAWLDILFLIDTSAAMSSIFLKQLSGEIATVLQYFTFNQNGNHTVRAGIIIYGSNFSTLFEFKNVTNFAEFEKVLLTLYKYYDPRDYGSNVYGALDASYRFLQIQKSFRLPLIVLVSATYNSSGFQGTSELSQSIKANGTSIVVINFAPENPDLTKSLQNISSEGYYYDSTQEDLYINLAYAFTQIVDFTVNCICPLHSKQFRIFNPSWNNYTHFADCFYGVPGDTSPIIANSLCGPGMLVAIQNSQIFDFITDQVIPNDLLKAKKFSIGLHKSDSDGLWKWWNYDGGESVLGDYPPISANPGHADNYGYMWNYYGFNWKLQTGENIPLPYICQLKACDAENICDLTPLKKKIDI